MKVFVGVDPGKEGAIAILDRSGLLMNVYDMPTVQNGKRRSLFVPGLVRIFQQLVTDYGSESIYMGIEKVGAMPGNSGQSMFTFGKMTGVIEGIAAGLNIGYVLPHPKTWQGKLLRDVEGSDTKARSMLAAGRMFPNLEMKRKRDHNRADAALIAAYVRMKHLGKSE